MTSTKFLLAALCNVVIMLAMVDASSVRRGQGTVLKVEDLANMDMTELLRNAVKVDDIDTRKRILQEDEDGEEGEGDDRQDEAQEEGNEEENPEEEGDDVDEQQVEEDEQDNEEEEEEQEDMADEEAEVEEDVEDDDEEEEEDELLQLRFLKCGAFTIQPNDEEITGYLATQESIVFFTVGYGDDDYERELYMTTLENWVRASTGYQDVCHKMDEDDVNTIFSTITDTTFAELYSEHAWYSGFNCLEDGYGFGSQLFLNEECTTYAPVMSNYYPFPEGTVIEAAAEGDDAVEEEEQQEMEQEENANNVDYTYRVASDLTPYMIQNADYFLASIHYCERKEGAEGQDQEGADQDIEFCENIFGVSVDVVTCNLYGEEVDQNQQQQQQQQQQCECAEEEEVEEEGEGNADSAGEQAEEQGQQDEEGNEVEGNEGQRKKRRRNQECQCADNGYQINYEQIGDVEASCATVRNILQIDQDSFNGMNAEYVVSTWNNVKDGHQPSSQSGNNNGWIIALVVVAAVVVVALIAFAGGRSRKKTESEASRAEPLVNSANKPPRKKKESIEIYFQGSKRETSADLGSQS
ncbi:hypothetical protein IV203_011580 [Nitzschia inconspicua]|uniref:Uncharacterized protein n=1 Tax=Nitzschia inconspicua TaxID=303405 RepID=A0A9K3KS99_9STRA|nr:hypothetical protein IV203_011580 [Nitzschia inconspicua]